MPTPVSPKTLAALVFSVGSHAQARWRRGTNALRRQILPTSLPGINHTGSGSRYSGTDLSGGINRNVMGRTEPHLRQHRQSPAGPEAVRSPSAKTNSPRNAASTGSLRAISTVDALIALQGVDDPKERKKRALVKGRNAFDVSSIPSSLDCSTEAWTNQRSHASRWHPRA